MKSQLRFSGLLLALPSVIAFRIVDETSYKRDLLGLLMMEAKVECQ
jgi:hypothetical protein